MAYTYPPEVKAISGGGGLRAALPAAHVASYLPSELHPGIVTA